VEVKGDRLRFGVRSTRQIVSFGKRGRFPSVFSESASREPPAQRP